MALKDTIESYAHNRELTAIENNSLTLVQRNGTDTTRKSIDHAFTSSDQLTITHRPVGQRTLHTITYSRRPKVDGGDAEDVYLAPVLVRLTFDGPTNMTQPNADAFIVAFRALLSAMADMDGTWPRVIGDDTSVSASDFSAVVASSFLGAVDAIVLGQS